MKNMLEKKFFSTGEYLPHNFYLDFVNESNVQFTEEEVSLLSKSPKFSIPPLTSSHLVIERVVVDLAPAMIHKPPDCISDIANNIHTVPLPRPPHGHSAEKHPGLHNGENKRLEIGNYARR